MDELLTQFLIEGRELIAQAHDALAALSRDPCDTSPLDSLFRATHTLKGSVALFEMNPAERLLHAAESHLESTRKAGIKLEAAAIDALVVIIDQTDRWIDTMELRGALDADAPAIASRTIALLTDGLQEGQSERPGSVVAKADRSIAHPTDDWVAALSARAAFAALDSGAAATAFRYTPDPDCFFRGEDPLAIAEKVPGLLALAVLPVADQWPALENSEPFRCMAVLEGLSTAGIDAVRATFRLVGDQVMIRPFSHTSLLDAVVERAGSDAASEASTMLRVEAAKLDRLANQSGELGVAARFLGPLVARVRAFDPSLAADLRAAQDEIERVATTLQRSIAQVRLVSLEPILRRLPRLARETAAALGKPLRFQLSGETSQVDKNVSDQLFEPLLHLVRNAIDHGIEPAGDRQFSGKPAEGLVSLNVRQDGETIVVRLTDDGCGIDPQAIRRAAVAKGLIASDAAEALDNEEALRLIFLPGFSTASQITTVSGRGVGMDVVKASIDRLAGSVAIDSVVGKGTTIELRLPANAISTKLLVVSVGHEQLGLRLDQISETARIPAHAIHPVGLGRACILRDTTVPVLDLAQLLGFGETEGEEARLIITGTGGSRTALRVDSLRERFDTVVRESVGLLAAVPAISGTALRADGSVLLVLDLSELIA